MPDNSHQKVTFASNGGNAHGCLAIPDAGSGPGIIVIQEWWGLTEHIKDVTDRFAREGFVALAPRPHGGFFNVEIPFGRYEPELAARTWSDSVPFLVQQLTRCRRATVGMPGTGLAKPDRGSGLAMG